MRLVLVLLSATLLLRAGEHPTPTPEARLIAANTAFALRLYRQVIANQEGDVVLGPHSISAALALAEAGAAGATRRGMDQVLGWTDLGEGLHPAWQQLHTSLAAVKGIELAMANRLFLQRGEPFLDSYLGLCRDRHGAAPEICDFARDPEAERRKINAWVGSQTKDRIPELLKREPPVITAWTVAALVNACYFKGGFTTPFQTRNTEAPAEFRTAKGKVACALMHQSGSMDHCGDERLDVVRLAYGPVGAPAAHLTLLVPKTVDGLVAIEQDLIPERLTTLVAGLKRQMVQLALPRFTSRTPIDLLQHLKDLGMPCGSDFSAMIKSPLVISAVVHETWIATDEAGSEAAAATAVVFSKGATPIAAVTLRIDRPFLWLITEARTGALLFVGRVVTPQDPGPAKAGQPKP